MNSAKDMFYSVRDVQDILDYSESKAYKVIRALNKELSEQGFNVRPGKVLRRYFNERYGLDDTAEKAGKQATAKARKTIRASARM